MQVTEVITMYSFPFSLTVFVLKLNTNIIHIAHTVISLGSVLDNGPYGTYCMYVAMMAVKW